MIALTLLISALAFVLFPFFESQLPLMACAFLLGLGLGASLPNMMSLVYRLAPKGRTGEAIGLRLMLINSSKATFPVAMGALGDWCRSVPVGACHLCLSGLSFCDAIGADGYRCGGRQSHGTLTDI